MDIFFFGLDPYLSEKRLRGYLRPKLLQFGIADLELEKISRGRCALLTILDKGGGQRFLQHYSDPKNELFLRNRFSCKPAKDAPDPFKIRVLETRISNTLRRIKNDNRRETPSTAENRVFRGTMLSCGIWSYSAKDHQLEFETHYMEPGNFELRFGKNMMVLLGPWAGNPRSGRKQRIDFQYSNVQNVVFKGLHDTTITFTLYTAPRVYLIAAPGEMSVILDRLEVKVRDRPDRRPRNVRVSGTSQVHAAVAGLCLVYQLTLLPSDVRAVRAILNHKTGVPSPSAWPFRQVPLNMTLTMGMRQLDKLFRHREFRSLDFGIKFQIQRLAQNGYLSPTTAITMLSVVSGIEEQHGLEVAIEATQRLARETPYAGPESEAEYFTAGHLQSSLQRITRAVLKEGSFAFGVTRRYKHLVLVHRVRITPSGIYLEGPEPEPKNQVIRMYGHRAFDSFLRVSFEEEDGDAIRFDYHGTLEAIHFGRFKGILEDKLSVAGRQFSFLGFSHSSLRDQTCWFMAPFTHDGRQLSASELIRTLGDFTSIHCPAKCAARIGQNFTDLNSTVELPPNCIQKTADVERNGRVFSDGCSAVSRSIIERIWKNFELLSFKATVFQIRLGGVKGMVSLDPRLHGDVLQVRPSQEKFPAPDLSKLGICGVAKRALPFYLNRQLVTVLGDLGVETEAFCSLQATAIRSLRMITESPINAAGFLERNDVGVATNLPFLFERLYYMGISVFDDRFLWSIIELSVLTNLRELKYRGRIPIENGVTLFGILDETDTLDEGEVYVSAMSKEAPITGPVAVTRSPALHPGDIQVAMAVSGDKAAPFQHLYNCIVFSQRGSRDLPSQLSGGDLDGDQFNIFWEPLIMPKRTVQAASYPRVVPENIGRAVDIQDMTDFMLKFIANDALGRVATTHLVLADKLPDGVFDPKCVALASLHSDAVDFSKTGVPADMSAIPRLGKIRPDFMAPGPRVRMMAGSPSFIPEQLTLDPDEEDPVDALNPEASETMYYESPKALGVLYRAIDERAFLDGLHKAHPSRSTDVLARIWDWVQKRISLVQWTHLTDWAEGIQEEYELAVLNLMSENSPNPQKPLQEVEVFTGTIIGKDGETPSKRVRDNAGTMRDRYDELARYTIESILRGDESVGLPGDQALERTIACLHTAVDPDLAKRMGFMGLYNATKARSARRTSARSDLRSWGYLCAILCLRQVDRFCEENGIR